MGLSCPPWTRALGGASQLPLHVAPSLSLPFASFASELIAPYFKNVQVLKFPLLSGKQRKVTRLTTRRLAGTTLETEEKRKKKQEEEQQRKSLFCLSRPLSPASVNASPPAQSQNINFAQHTLGNLLTS